MKTVRPWFVPELNSVRRVRPAPHPRRTCSQRGKPYAGCSRTPASPLPTPRAISTKCAKSDWRQRIGGRHDPSFQSVSSGRRSSSGCPEPMPCVMPSQETQPGLGTASEGGPPLNRRLAGSGWRKLWFDHLESGSALKLTINYPSAPAGGRSRPKPGTLSPFAHPPTPVGSLATNPCRSPQIGEEHAATKRLSEAPFLGTVADRPAN